MLHRKVLALLTFVFLGLAAAPARADVVQLFSPAELGGGVTTDYPNLPAGATGLIFNTPIVVSTAGVTVTFTAAGGQLVRRNEGGGFLGSFPTGTELIVTDSTAGTGTGPLTITFSVPIVSFGVFAQNTFAEADETSSFSFSLFDGATLLGTFSRSGPDFVGAVQTDPLFLGARAILSQRITRIEISGASTVDDPAAQNNFAVGPVTFQPIPEPATMLLLGTGLAGVAAARRRGRRKPETE